MLVTNSLHSWSWGATEGKVKEAYMWNESESDGKNRGDIAGDDGSCPGPHYPSSWDSVVLRLKCMPHHLVSCCFHCLISEIFSYRHAMFPCY